VFGYANKTVSKQALFKTTAQTASQWQLLALCLEPVSTNCAEEICKE
jgi:hypothetical protein